MTSVIRKWIEKFPHRSSTSTRVLLSRVAKTSGYGCKKNCLEISFRGTVKSQRDQKSAKLLAEFNLVLHIDHEVIIGSFAEELRANDGGFLASRHGCRTSPMPQDTKEII